MVPFEPKEGRPVYCKDCMFKIKSGELKPQTGFVASRSARQDERTSTAPLAALGIEFTSTGTKPPEIRPKISAPSTFSKTPLTSNTRAETPRPPLAKDAPRNTGPRPESTNSPAPRPEYKPQERKHSGPSPLLKGLLDKIEEEKKQPPIAEKKPEVIEVKAPVVSPISLSALKKPDAQNSSGPRPGSANSPMPVKEASEEKKASLKDLLARATAPQPEKSQEKPVEKKEQNIPGQRPESADSSAPINLTVNNIHINEKPEPAVQPVVQNIPAPTAVRPSHESTHSFANPPAVEKKEEPKTDTWQKQVPEKEVPEDVLRKVLE